METTLPDRPHPTWRAALAWACLAGALLLPGTCQARVQPLGDSSGVAISDDSRYLAFTCNEPNLLPYDTGFTTGIPDRALEPAQYPAGGYAAVPMRIRKAAA